MTSIEIIRERLEIHRRKEFRPLYHGLRMLVAGEYDRRMSTSSRYMMDAEHPDIIKSRWDLGVTNPAGNNTSIQVKSLTIAEPQIRWDKCFGERPEVTAAIRREYYLRNWREGQWADMYRLAFFDLLTCGERNVLAWVRGPAPYLEYLDSLRVTWDPAFKDQTQKRWVCYDKPLPLLEAVKLYPEAAQALGYNPERPTGVEKTVWLTCYWDGETRAVFKDSMQIYGPVANPVGKIPVERTVFMQEPSVAHPTGQVEPQVGSHSLLVRLMRSFREVALRMVPVGVAKGEWEQTTLDRLRAGQEGAIIEGKPSSDFQWLQGGMLTPAQVQLFELAQQNNNTESGLNDFNKSRTDTKVDFASQLALLAQQSGAQGQYAVQRAESAIIGDARTFLELGSEYERRPMSFNLGQTMIEFDEMMPISAQLGRDGEITMAPGGLQYKTNMQKLQETAILASVLAQSTQLPEPLVEPFVTLALSAYEIDNPDEWLRGFEEMRAAQAAEQDFAMQQAEQAASQNRQPGPRGQAA